MWDASPVLIKMPKVFFVDDGPGKPEGINHFIGRRPIFAFGNSDGDKEMLEWTAAGDGLRFMGLVYHTDAAREYAYGPAGGLPDSKVGTFSQALMDEAKGEGLDHRRHEERLEDDLPCRPRRAPETKVPGDMAGHQLRLIERL